MAAPSNIRINPFIGDGGTTNYMNFTEVHIIPAVSPFVVRLNEVPQKKDPSNMKVVYVDDTTGTPTANALTEVAATPGAGEFRPDYSTNADGDEDWNTGLIEFSSADAGKSIQVSYTGMGTLAGVKNNRFPSWWLDRGDGSDGDFRPTGNTTISGLKQYRSVFIPAGVTVSVDKYVRICCQGAFICLGTITAKGKGGKGGSLNDRGDSGMAGNGGTGISNPGGSGWEIFGVKLPVDVVSDIILNTLKGYGYGAGGGGGGSGGVNYGGDGGGSIAIVSNTFKNEGTISADGNKGDRYAGGGGGGVVVVCANNIINKGNITANGGAAGGGNSDSGPGGSGIVKVIEIGVM